MDTNLQNQTITDTSDNIDLNNSAPIAVDVTQFTDTVSERITDDSQLDDPTISEENAVHALGALENIIRQRLPIIEKTQLELSELRTRLTDMLANSEEYYNAERAVKEATKVKKQIKATIMGSKEAQELQAKFDDSRNLLKEHMDTLSDMLLEYYEAMRIKEIDDHEGNQRDLIVKVKVAPKKQK